MAELTLKSGREKPLLRRHPWVFSGAIARVRGDPGIGETVEIISGQGEWLARGAYSPHSKIRARIWTWNQDEKVDGAFFRRRLKAAGDLRGEIARDAGLDAFRQVFAESDAIPGLIVDRYADYVVIQLLSAGVELWRDEIIAALVEWGDCVGILERSDVQVRSLEGLPQRKGTVWGEPAPECLVIREHGDRFLVDIVNGHKTGFYLDQRDSRDYLRGMALDGLRVLNAFCYTGGFTVGALQAGAEQILSIDSSGSAMELALENVRLNGLSLDSCRWSEGDVFRELRTQRDRGEIFDLVILDPPRLAPTISQVERASRAYKDLNLLAFKLLAPGGCLMTFSCSGGVSVELFQKIVAGAAVDAGVDASVIAWLSQPGDHPVSLTFPEGRYLKGLVCKVRGV